jgi:hypothetical protein
VPGFDASAAELKEGGIDVFEPAQLVLSLVGIHFP